MTGTRNTRFAWWWESLSEDGDMNQVLGIAAASMLAVLGGCQAFVPVPTLEVAGGDAALVETLNQGRKIYIRKCSGCHALRSINKYSDSKWPIHVRTMRNVEKVRLKDADLDKLILYLTTMNGRD